MPYSMAFLRSKTIAWLAFFLIIVVIITTYKFRPAWWAFIDEFFAFMMVFSQLAALYIYKFNAYAGSRLQLFAAIFAALTLLSFIGEFIAYWIIYY